MVNHVLPPLEFILLAIEPSKTKSSVERIRRTMRHNKRGSKKGPCISLSERGSPDQRYRSMIHSGIGSDESFVSCCCSCCDCCWALIVVVFLTNFTHSQSIDPMPCHTKRHDRIPRHRPMNRSRQRPTQWLHPFHKPCDAQDMEGNLLLDRVPRNTGTGSRVDCRRGSAPRTLLRVGGTTRSHGETRACERDFDGGTESLP